MTTKTIEEEFYFLINKNTKIKDNCIYIPYEDPDLRNKLTISFVIIIGFILIILANKFSLIFYIILLAKIVHSFKELGTLFVVLLTLTSPCILMLVLPGLKTKLDNYFHSYKIIDFNKEALYTQQCFFGAITKKDYTYIKDILVFCNNVIPQKDTPFDKGKKHDLYEIGVNPNTNFYHNYYFSFLLKEGKLIDYLKLVYSGKKYELTLKLAKSLADHFNIESSFCRNYCTNEVEIISKENNLYSIESHKITEKDLIESDDNPESDFIFTGTIILLIAFGIVGLSFNIEVDYKWIDDYLNYLRNGK